KQYFLERQKETNQHIEQFARNKFGSRFTDEVFIPARTETENFQYPLVWCKDMNANNIIYNPDSKDISFIDFNVVEQRISEFDKIKFVDTPITGNCFSRDKMISMVGGKTQSFDRMSQYLNLRHMLGRYEGNDKETARFFYERSGINNENILI
ncbi:MAG: hypothetical protein KAI26_02435, partial [Nanoarchaeota archaeon]|nr:hypothetical protein [Nanoarchaeota archaeon]